MSAAEGGDNLRWNRTKFVGGVELGWVRPGDTFLLSTDGAEPRPYMRVSLTEVGPLPSADRLVPVVDLERSVLQLLRPTLRVQMRPLELVESADPQELQPLSLTEEAAALGLIRYDHPIYRWDGEMEQYRKPSLRAIESSLTPEDHQRLTEQVQAAGEAAVGPPEPTEVARRRNSYERKAVDLSMAERREILRRHEGDKESYRVLADAFRIGPSTVARVNVEEREFIQRIHREEGATPEYLSQLYGGVPIADVERIVAWEEAIEAAAAIPATVDPVEETADVVVG